MRLISLPILFSGALVACAGSHPLGAEGPDAETPPALDAGAPPVIADAAQSADARSTVMTPVVKPLADASAAFVDGAVWGTGATQYALPGHPDDPAYKALASELAAKRALDAAGILAAYPSKPKTRLSYDPRSAQFMERIQASALALNGPELEVLGQNGFVISRRREFPNFVRGLAEIYSEHLPLFVSADALLDSVHRNYDAILRDVEQRVLIGDLRVLLRGLLSGLSQLGEGDPEVLRGIDEYLCVALGLLEGAAPAPVKGGDPSKIAALIADAVEAQGTHTFKFFGKDRWEDFSQFKPRGHYADGTMLELYFRAQMWLGRVDFRLIEVNGGAKTFNRAQYEAMLVLHQLLEPHKAWFDRIDGVIRTFVGLSDSLNPDGATELIRDLGGAAAARAAKDDAVIAAIEKGGYGTQQIMSHLTFVTDDGKPDELSRSFLLLGQRYVVDSHVFSSLVHDRVPYRMMPNPLDAAFAALGNAQALSLMTDLRGQLPGALAAMRTVVDAHAPSFWTQSLYNQWLRALRALSPAPDPSLVPGLPEVAQNEAWGRRILNTQLGSWAQLRHDTLLYAKQSYTGIPICEYPDAYVDPYPAFYEALHEYALAGQRMAEKLPFSPTQDSSKSTVPRYFAALERVTAILGEMAQRELRGEPFSAEQMAFINQAVRIESHSAGCASIPIADGWYADLFLDRAAAIEADLPIADVHTQPADETGDLVGKILHVGTGYPRFMVTTVDTCMGPRAYAGVVFAYHEETTRDFKRLTDQEWAARFQMGGARPAELSWIGSVAAR